MMDAKVDLGGLVWIEEENTAGSGENIWLHGVSLSSLPYSNNISLTWANGKTVIILHKCLKVKKTAHNAIMTAWSYIENPLVLLFRNTFSKKITVEILFSQPREEISTHFFSPICHNSRFTYRKGSTLREEVSHPRVDKQVGGLFEQVSEMGVMRPITCLNGTLSRQDLDDVSKCSLALSPHLFW